MGRLTAAGLLTTTVDRIALSRGGDDVMSDQMDRRFGLRARTALSLLSAFIVMAAAVSCSTDDTVTPPATLPDGSSTTSSTSATSVASTQTTTSPPSESAGSSVEDEIVARYVGFWDARFAANSGTPNPDDPALREFATGPQLEAVVAETRANLEQGLALRPADRPASVRRVTVVEIDGDRAVVQECAVTDGVIIRRDTSDIVDDEVYTQNVRGELLRVDGVWRLSAARLIQQWEGIVGCALAS
jgi:hypothetical protein